MAVRAVAALLLMWMLASCAKQSTPPAPVEPHDALSLPPWAEPASSAAARPQPLRNDQSRSLAAPAHADPLDRMLHTRGARKLAALSFHHAPLPEVLRMLAASGGFNIVIADDVPEHHVTLELKNATVQHAFRAVLEASRLDATLMGDDIVLVRNPKSGP